MQRVIYVAAVDILVKSFFHCLQGALTTLQISIYAFLLGTAIGIPMALMSSYGGSLSKMLVSGYQRVLRGIPVLILMMIFYYGLAYRIPLLRNAFVSATLALGIRSGAYQSQTFRGAMRGVKETQMMAARSIGLSKVQAFRHVMLPQMFIVAVSGLGSEYALLVKDSAYAFIIAVSGDVLNRADNLRASLYSNLPYFPAALIYILLTFPVATFLDRWGSKQKRKYGL